MTQATEHSKPQTNASSSALRTLDHEIAGLQLLRQSLEGTLGATLNRAVILLLSLAGRIHVTGIGKSGHIARKLAATLSSTGTPAHFLHPTEASHGDLGALTPDDLLLALSWSGDTPELLPLIEYCRTTGVPLVAITAHPRSLLARAATTTLTLPLAPEACPGNLAPTTSTTMQLALGDAFALAILEARALPDGHYPASFRALHPGGKLGARLTPASAVMHTADRLPLVASGTPLSVAIVEMSSKGFGVTGILSPAGTLIGILTDGDLRRAFSRVADPLGNAVDEAMTHNPWTIPPEALAPDILTHMTATRITSTFIVDERHFPKGIIHLHDLLRLGLEAR